MFRYLEIIQSFLHEIDYQNYQVTNKFKIILIYMIYHTKYFFFGLGQVDVEGSNFWITMIFTFRFFFKLSENH